MNGKVKLTKSVVIKPFQTVYVSSLTECSQHFKRVNVIVESDPKKEYGAAILINGYTVLKPGSSQVSVGIRNISCQRVMIQARTVIAKIAAANVVPHSYAPNVESYVHLQRLCALNSKKMSADSHNAESEGLLEAPPLTLQKKQL